MDDKQNCRIGHTSKLQIVRDYDKNKKNLTRLDHKIKTGQIKGLRPV